MAYEVAGWAGRWTLDHYRHVISPSAFNDSIRQKGLRGPKAIRLLWQHHRDKPLGVITKLEPHRDGLWMEAEIEDGISYGKDVALAAKAAGGLSFSVGFFLVDADIAEDSAGREYLHILKGDLEEVSVVVFPGHPDANMEAKSVPEADPLAKLEAIAAKLSLMNRERLVPTGGTHYAKMQASLAELKDIFK